MLVKDTIEKGHLPKRWLFLNRDDPTTTDYCVVEPRRGVRPARGHAENASADEFGPPGSGYPRCATSDADSPARSSCAPGPTATSATSIILYTASPKTAQAFSS